MDERERLRQQTASAAQAYWRSLLRRVRGGRDLAAQREEWFLAGSSSSRVRLAREFYGRAHLKRLAALNRSEVLTLLCPWPDAAIEAVLEWGDDEPKARHRALARLVKSQYVVRVESHGGGTPTVEPYPSEALYGDLYELSASGFSVGGIIYLYKATGEAFNARERRTTFSGMRQDFYVNAASDGVEESGWAFKWLWDQGDNRVIVVSVDLTSSDDDG